MNFSAIVIELKVETPIGDYIDCLRSTGGAEPQETGGIARALIVDLKIYPGIPMPQ